MKRALKSFAVGNRVIAKDQIVEDDSPVVAGRDALFEDVTLPENKTKSTKSSKPKAKQPEQPSDAGTDSKPAKKSTRKSSKKI